MTVEIDRNWRDKGVENPSRRRLLERGFKVAVAAPVVEKKASFTAAIVAERMVFPMWQQFWDRYRTNVSADTFLSQNRDLLSNVRIGMTFRPEEFNLSLEEKNQDKERGITRSPESLSEPTFQEKYDQALEALRLIIDELGVRDVRLGVRWGNTVNSKGKFDFSFYKPFFDLCIEKGVNITLNFGMKTAGWPEEHIPQQIVNESDFSLARNALIEDENPDAIRFIAHAGKLFGRLTDIYTSEQLSRITTIQPENEGFKQFGELKLLMDPNYVITLIDLAHQYLPNAAVLLNSADSQNYVQIQEVFEELKRRENWSQPLYMGTDFYPFHPGIPKIPVLGRPDIITISKIIQQDRFKSNLKKSKEIGYLNEVTEGQVEPWDEERTPGNSLSAYQFMIYRARKYILSDDEPALIRAWGFERELRLYLSGQMTDEQRKILDLTARINKKDFISRFSKSSMTMAA